MKELFERITDYVTYFTDDEFKKKLRVWTGKAGAGIIYYATLLYLLLTKPEIPLRSRLIIMGALGYFILPADLVADVLPILGFADDMAFLTFAFRQVTAYVTPELEEEAHQVWKPGPKEVDVVEDPD